MAKDNLVMFSHEFDGVEHLIAKDQFGVDRDFICPNNIMVISENNTYPVKDCKEVDVQLPEQKAVKLKIAENGEFTPDTYSGEYYDEVTVQMATELTDEEITITENGTYKPSTGKMFSKVTVDVPCDTMVGYDEWGNPVTPYVDPTTGKLEIDKLPDHINVTVNPTKTDYLPNETIDYSGIEVRAYNKDGSLWTKMGYKNGVIPFKELIFEVGCLVDNTKIHDTNGIAIPFSRSHLAIIDGDTVKIDEVRSLNFQSVRNALMTGSGSYLDLGYCYIFHHNRLEDSFYFENKTKSIHSAVFCTTYSAKPDSDGYYSYNGNQIYIRSTSGGSYYLLCILYATSYLVSNQTPYLFMDEYRPENFNVYVPETSSNGPITEDEGPYDPGQTIRVGKQYSVSNQRVHCNYLLMDGVEYPYVQEISGEVISNQHDLILHGRPHDSYFKWQCEIKTSGLGVMNEYVFKHSEAGVTVDENKLLSIAEALVYGDEKITINEGNSDEIVLVYNAKSDLDIGAVSAIKYSPAGIWAKSSIVSQSVYDIHMTGKNVCFTGLVNTGRYGFYYVAASKEPAKFNSTVTKINLVSGVESSVSKEVQCTERFTYNDKTVYFSRGVYPVNAGIVEVVPSAIDGMSNMFDYHYAEIAWTIVYGGTNTINYSMSVPIKWKRPGDSKVLETNIELQIILPA